VKDSGVVRIFLAI